MSVAAVVFSQACMLVFSEEIGEKSFDLKSSQVLSAFELER